MFERFTEKAIKIIMLAQEEARRLGHNFVGTEFILLGLIGEGTGIGAKTLKSVGVNLKDTRTEVEKIVGRGKGFVAVEIPFTPNAKRQLELSWDEAKQLGCNYIGTEHLLLALIRMEESTGLKVLENLKLDTDIAKIRVIIIRLIGERGAGDVSLHDAVKHAAIKSDQLEMNVNKTLFEGIISALPTDIQPMALNLREVVCDKEEAIQSRWLDQVEQLRREEINLLEQISERMTQSPEERKVAEELRKIRREKEQAIRAQEFDKAASLREKETELSDKLRELKNKSAEKNEPKE